MVVVVVVVVAVVVVVVFVAIEGRKSMIMRHVNLGVVIESSIQY